MENPESMERLSRQAAVALESGDLSAFSDLLDPNVRWGPPGDTSPPCQNRGQVLAWYQRGQTAGATAKVSEVTVLGDRILVGLVVDGTNESRKRGGTTLRWQLLTIRESRVVEIVGFDRRDEAATYAELATD